MLDIKVGSVGFEITKTLFTVIKGSRTSYKDAGLFSRYLVAITLFQDLPKTKVRDDEPPSVICSYSDQKTGWTPE